MYMIKIRFNTNDYIICFNSFQRMNVNDQRFENK